MRWVIMELSGHIGSGKCEHRAIHCTNEKKISPSTEVEAMSGHGYCDLSAG